MRWVRDVTVDEMGERCHSWWDEVTTRLLDVWFFADHRVLKIIKWYLLRTTKPCFKQFQNKYDFFLFNFWMHCQTILRTKQKLHLIQIYTTKCKSLTNHYLKKIIALWHFIFTTDGVYKCDEIDSVLTSIVHTRVFFSPNVHGVRVIPVLAAFVVLCVFTNHSPLFKKFTYI